MATNKTYDASSITWLKGLEGVRKKPAMYIGETDTVGVTHLFKEIIGNAIDEAVNGHGNVVGLDITGQTVTVFDNGRGIPTGKHPKHKNVDVLTILATELHAGGKLSATDTNYQSSTGTHGLGLSVVNALSANLTIWSINAASHTGVKKQSFEKGKPITDVITVDFKDVPKCNGKPWMKQGTVVQYTWDKTVFDKGSKLDTKAVMSYIRDISFFNFQFNSKKKTPITFMCCVNGKYAEITRKSITSFVSFAIKRLGLKKEPTIIEGSTFGEYGTTTDLVMCWSDMIDPHFYSAVNSLPTSQGGTHLKGALKAIEDAFKTYAGKKSEFRQQDIMAGVVGCINTRVASPRFDSQSKARLTTAETTDIVYKETLQVVTKWIKANKDIAKQIVDRAVAINKATNDSKLTRQLAAALNTKKGGKSLLPPNLVQCTAKNPEDRHLYIVEGDSAAGTGRKASNRAYQEVLPLRGKILNVNKTDDAKMTGSSAIISLLQSIGYDPKNPQGKLRVGQIYVLSDPDPDGIHRGTQRVLTLDGENPTFIQLAKEFEEGRPTRKIYCKDADGNMIIGDALYPKILRYETKQVVIKTDDGSIFKCSLDHKFALTHEHPDEVTYRGIKYVAAENLEAGDCFDSIYFKKDALQWNKQGRDYLHIVNHAGQAGDRKDMPVHQFVKMREDPEKFQKYRDKNQGVLRGRFQIHHVDDNPLNNNPENLKYISTAKHYGLHGKQMALAYNGSEKHKEDLANFYKSKEGKLAKIQASNQITAYNTSDEHRDTVSKMNSDPVIKHKQKCGAAASILFILERDGVLINRSNWQTCGLLLGKMTSFNIYRKHEKEVRTYLAGKENSIIARFKFKDAGKIQKYRGMFRGLSHKATYLLKNNLLTRKNLLARIDMVWEDLNTLCKKAIGVTAEQWYQSKKNRIKYTKNKGILYGAKNHTIVSVKIVDLKKPTPMYCITVPQTGNFYVMDKHGNGILSKNCLDAKSLIKCKIDNVEQTKTIEELSIIWKQTQSPIEVQSTVFDPIKKTSTNQFAKAYDIRPRIASLIEYRVVLQSGAEIKCDPSHKFCLTKFAGTIAEHNRQTNFYHVAVTQLKRGDLLFNPKTNKPDPVFFIESYALNTLTEYYCMTVPMYGNFASVSTNGQEILNSNCHINSLVLSVLWKTIPHAFEQEKINVIEAPLFVYSTPKQKLYGNTLADLMAKIGKGFDFKNVTRLKGYGEANPDELRTIAFDETTRKAIKVTAPMMQGSVNAIMGDDTAIRKELLGLD